MLEDFRARTRIGHQFIIPGASVGGAALDLARTIIRRGERQVARLLHDGEIGNAEVLRYLNRASDLVFILARVEEGGHSDPTKPAAGLLTPLLITILLSQARPTLAAPVAIRHVV